VGGGLDIVAEIGGRSVPRREVLEWEGRRATKVCKKLGIAAPLGDLAAQREALVARKLELGHEALELRRLGQGRCRVTTRRQWKRATRRRCSPPCPDHYVLCRGADGTQ